MSDATDVVKEKSNGPKWKWLIGPFIGILFALLGGAVAYGGLTATAGATAEDVTDLEDKLDGHVAENKTDNKELDKRLNQQDIGMAEQRILLIRIDSKLDDIKDNFKGHLRGHP